MDSIILRRINPYQIAQKYLAGDYDIVKLTEIKTDTNNTYGFTNNRFVYHGINPKAKIECCWCRDVLDMTNEEIIKGKRGGVKSTKKRNKEVLGIPYESEYDHQNKITTYRTVLFVDCYECGYALLQILALRNPGLYMGAEKNILSMFTDDHPGKTLRPANDPWLQERCGGPLKKTDYIKSKYIPTPNRILVHTSQEYMSLD